jgi:transcriptional regulator with XRE-family HTH domain
MDDQRRGAAFRAVRIRRGWRQADLAAKAGLAPSVVSLVERGRLESVSFKAMRRIARSLDVRLELTMRMPHGALERLLNAGHAALHESLARYLSALPEWVHAPEVSFAFYGERGVIDILAFHAATGSVLVIELKTELVSARGPTDDDGPPHSTRSRDCTTKRLERDVSQCVGRPGGEPHHGTPSTRPPCRVAVGVSGGWKVRGRLARTTTRCPSGAVFLDGFERGSC